MRIALLAAGSRGDYQPALAVGRGLQARGHQVGVTATREFVGLVEAAGLSPEPVDVDAMAYYRDQLALHAMPTDLGGQLLAASRQELRIGAAHHRDPASLTGSHDTKAGS